MSVPLLLNHNYLVLLALADGPKHGLAVQKRIVGDTVGYLVTNSSLYATLKRLGKAGLVEMSPDGERRTYYELTNEGRRRLEMESQTLKEAAKLAQQRLGYR